MGSSSASPLAFRLVLAASLRNSVLDTPGISTGDWKLQIMRWTEMHAQYSVEAYSMQLNLTCLTVQLAACIGLSIGCYQEVQLHICKVSSRGYFLEVKYSSIIQALFVQSEPKNPS